MDKTAKVRRLASAARGDLAGLPAPSAPLTVAEVMAVQGAHFVRCQVAGKLIDMAVATHLPAPMPGQRVLVALVDSDAPLVVAVYPAHSAAAPSSHGPAPIAMDPATGVLRIEAPHLQLAGLASVELRCGTAVLRFSAQGEVALEAEAITQSAVGAYRIEGASIDLN